MSLVQPPGSRTPGPPGCSFGSVPSSLHTIEPGHDRARPGGLLWRLENLDFNERIFKEIKEWRLIDVTAVRGVGISGSTVANLSGASAKAPQPAEPYTATPTSSCSTNRKPLVGAGNAELRTIMLHCLLSSEYF
jgi:hypothetical protein